MYIVKINQKGGFPCRRHIKRGIEMLYGHNECHIGDSEEENAR